MEQQIRPDINLSSAMLGLKVDIFIMAGKRKQLPNDIKNVIVEMRKSGHKLQEIADTLNAAILDFAGKLWVPVNYGTALYI
jgi:hypothetical protein